MKKILLIICSLLWTPMCFAQEIKMTQTASLEQVYGETLEENTPMPFDELDMENGYILYQVEIDTETKDALLEVDNIRDFAAVYINGSLQGTLTDSQRKLELNVPPGKYTLCLYVENIGRITYGPEILDNSKGLFGSVFIDGAEITGWKMTELKIKETDVTTLTFNETAADKSPAFFKGEFDIDAPKDCYLDISGWGMGEVWINGIYAGSFWEGEKQQSIQIPSSALNSEKNYVVVFDIKNNGAGSMKLVDSPVFK
ncbi:hypothetical protein [Dysgonomonas sp. 511]|uniref:hypothetical protein n=1 Tax=Dysgonomonas sp. 511 TaxID=2302930 RepID=UPI0013D32987|nr:hypothetical protein [Dysgonomonas sp. 511]NDV79182.1 hypothetical protein [Dysgonomonas sp. 511]